MHPPVVVFSHLRWDFVFQRPQHVLSRIASRRPVIFIEEPVVADGGADWELSTPAPGVLVSRPRTPVAAAGFVAAQSRILARLVGELLRSQHATRPIAWLYTPMALPLARSVEPRLVVYDCMDELSAFLHAPPELRTLESELLECADLVFTGGPSLHRAKR